MSKEQFILRIDEADRPFYNIFAEICREVREQQKQLDKIKRLNQ